MSNACAARIPSDQVSIVENNALAVDSAPAKLAKSSYIAGAAKNSKATCNICFEEMLWAGSIIGRHDVILEDSETTCCPSGKHIICRDCISELVKSKVSDGMVEIRCFDPSCTAQAMTPDEVQRCVTRQVI